MGLDNLRYMVLMDYTYDDNTEEFIAQEIFDTYEEAFAFCKTQIEYDDSMRFRIDTIATVAESEILTSQQLDDGK